jgi:effector-binding domain-containing protein
MSDLEVRIVRLETMRVVSSYGYGNNPEEIAWSKLMEWAASQGIEDFSAHRLFGFNNPNPSPGSPNYGYEQWMTVGADAEAEGDVEIKEVPGGLYAVTRCEGLENLGRIWKQLAVWVEESRYRRECSPRQWLEENLTPNTDFIFDLYVPVAE